MQEQSSLHSQFVSQFRKVDQTLERTYRYGGFQEFCLSVHFFQKEKMMRLLWLKNFYLRKLYNSNENQLGRNQIFLPEISLLL